jgi:shikimate kinase
MVAPPESFPAGLNRDRRLFLAGFMGAGKSVVGSVLAEKLGWVLIDLDETISKRDGRSIPEIFEEGEEAFREIERTELFKIIERDGAVIALGGGVLGWKDNLDLVKRCGILVYLRAGTDSLLRRLSRNVHDRPILDGRTGEELRTYIDHLLEIRRPYYEAADITVEASDNRTVDGIAEEIVNAFRSRLPADTG